jgi:hypothetical protein
MGIDVCSHGPAGIPKHSDAMTPEYSFVFVCQRGGLEPMAMLLAASLDRFVTCPYEMVAAVPSPDRYGDPDSSTLKMLTGLGARVVPIENRVDESYPIANKISALGISTHGRRRVFLDTDFLCLRPFAGDAQLDAAFGAVPAAMRTWGRKISDWDNVYASFGLTTPTVRVKTVKTREETPPYYNAGFIVAAGDVADPLARLWLECAKVIDANPAIPEKRPWLDQIALPVAVTRLGVSHHFLDETFNHAGGGRLSPDDPPRFCHYHSLLALKRHQFLNRLVRDLAERHAPLKQRMMAERMWRDVLSPGFGLLDTVQTFKNVRRWLAPRGTRREHLASTVKKGVRAAFSSLKVHRG